MGTWGFNIRQDDFVCDVIDAYENILRAGKRPSEASIAVTKRFASQIDDEVEGPLFWIGLGEAQWTYGALQPDVLQRVRSDLKTERSLAQWAESKRQAARRKVVLEKFIEKLSTPNPKPKQASMIVAPRSKFEPGDCLSIKHPDGQFGAALVLASEESRQELGKTLIAMLDYLGRKTPPLDVFTKRKWLRLTHHSWENVPDLNWYLPTGFRSVMSRIEVVGQIELQDSDPRDTESSCNWFDFGDQILQQRKWDKQQAKKK